VLDVLPQISADNVLTMDIRPSVTSIAHIDSISIATGGNGITSATAPAIDRREGDTIARLRAGETVVIGGLVQTTKNHNVSGIPILRDLPIIGKAFTSVNDTESRNELVIFLTPTIVSGQPVVSR
jgi:general secretion pathway protein D